MGFGSVYIYTVLVEPYSSGSQYKKVMVYTVVNDIIFSVKNK